MTLLEYATRRNWPNYYSPSRDFLYRSTVRQYTVHRRIRRSVYSFFEVDLDNDLPEDIVPVDITDIADGWRISRPRVLHPIDPEPHPVQTFNEYIASRPDYEALLLLRYELLGGDIFEIGTMLQNLDDIILVSDGGAFAEYGSYGWVLGTKEGTCLAQGSGAAFGYDPRSYRAEGYGAKAGTLFILLALKYCDYKVPSGGFEFHCDNQGLIRKLEGLRDYNNAIYVTCLHSEWDVVSSVYRLHRKFPTMPYLFHVYGHQDSGSSCSSLSLASQMNVEADLLASMEL